MIDRFIIIPDDNGETGDIYDRDEEKFLKVIMGNSTETICKLLNGFEAEVCRLDSEKEKLDLKVVDLEYKIEALETELDIINNRGVIE